MSPYLVASIFLIAFLVIGTLVLAFLVVTFVGSAIRQTALRARSAMRAQAAGRRARGG